MGWRVHGNAGCCDLNRKTEEIIFLFGFQGAPLLGSFIGRRLNITTVHDTPVHATMGRSILRTNCGKGLFRLVVSIRSG